MIHSRRVIESLSAFMTAGRYRNVIFLQLLSGYNAVIGRDSYVPPTDLEDFAAVQDQARRDTDIADHLPTIFSETVRAEPDTIVELGVRDGESTAVFEAVARDCGADLISVDIDESRYNSDYEGRSFVQTDDVEFAERFDEWCGNRDVSSRIDLLFIDTSHLYEHTVEEIDAWFPYLADDGVALFHDTNLSNIYRRRDRTLHTAWDNDRGVIRAIEEHLDCSFNEKRRFTTVCSGFLVEHHPHSNGFTSLSRVDRTVG